MAEEFNPPVCELCESRMDSIFENITVEQQQYITSHKTCNFYKRGEVIFEEGQRPNGLYCVNRGKVKVYKLGDEGREQIVRLDKAGNILGYRALISGEPYKAAASALENCVVCFIPGSVIFEMLENSPEISFRMMQIFSSDLKNAENLLTDFTQKPVRERLAQTILSLYHSYGTSEDGNLNIYLTRQEWANLMGTTTETAIRTISEFNKESIISIKGKKIGLTSKEALEAMTEF